MLKSDNANGVFAFSSAQSLSKMASETAGNVSFVIQRTVGFAGEVTVNWTVFHQNGSRASDDFVHPSGSVVFANEEKQKVRHPQLQVSPYCLCSKHPGEIHKPCSQFTNLVVY